ncbi:hypothetical protein SCP_0505570 [Sparassis crispa]|uniref:Uncharacterized protein n=1 Tax=Sparassis crispa TaxID=139825 RepID=A0A401GMR9_9APHY|nr:hypothetical protein SCP_0505570 [Sparassis crispa]GBE83506.1 hypothetical protein SCP_0505570 [Sparassis crispa]
MSTCYLCGYHATPESIRQDGPAQLRRAIQFAGPPGSSASSITSGVERTIGALRISDVTLLVDTGSISRCSTYVTLADSGTM